MNAIYLLIPLSLLFLLLAMLVFLWAAKSKQFDDLESPGMSILLDDERASHSVDSTPNDTIGSRLSGIEQLALASPSTSTPSSVSVKNQHNSKTSNGS